MSIFEDKSFILDAHGVQKSEAEQHGGKKGDLNVSISRSVFSDQTPTPTRFIRNCEEVGLFQDLQNVNPFEETFRKATEAVRKGDLASQMTASTLPTSDDTLHTPNVFPNIALPSIRRSPTKEAPRPPTPPPETRKYVKKKHRQETPAPSHCVIFDKNVTFKLPIPKLPQGIKVFAPKYFKPAKPRGVRAPVTDPGSINTEKNDKQESNRMAAMRSREKKKHYVAFLERHTQELKEKNSALERKVAALTRQMDGLRGLSAKNVRDAAQQTEEDSSESHLLEETKFDGGRCVIWNSVESVGADHNYLDTSVNYADERRIFYATLPNTVNTSSPTPCFLKKPFKKRRIGRKENEMNEEPS